VSPGGVPEGAPAVRIPAHLAPFMDYPEVQAAAPRVDAAGEEEPEAAASGQAPMRLRGRVRKQRRQRK